MAKSLTVTSYKDNPDGTTTNTLSDGSTDTGRYSNNQDGSLTFNPLPDANSLLAQYNKSGPLSIDQMLGTKPDNQIITGETLTTQKQITVPPAPSETASTKYDMATAGVFTEQDKPEQTDRQVQQGEDNTRMREIVTSLLGQPKEAIKEQEKAGLFAARERLGEFNKQKKLLDDEYFNARKEIEKNTEGKFGGAVSQDLRNLEREYRDNDYKLAVKKSVANEDISTALAISQAYIDAKYEPLKLELDYLKTFSEMAKDDLSESESLELQSTIRQREQSLADTKAAALKVEETRAQLLSMAYQQGAPASVTSAISNAKTVEEAIAAAGIYGGDVLARRKALLELDALTPYGVSEAKDGVTFEEFLAQKEDEAGQTFSESRREAIRAEYDAQKGGSSATDILSSVRNLRFATVEESKRIIGNVTRAIQSGDIQGAEDELRSFGYQKLQGSQKTDYDLYDATVSGFESALSTLDDPGLIAGAYKSLYEKAKPWLTMSKDKQYVDLRGRIELAQAQLRKGYYGTAVTGTEAANAQNFLIQDEDDIQTIKWKLENASNFLRFVNDATIARAVNLPKPNIKNYITPSGSSTESVNSAYLKSIGLNGILN